MKLSEIKQKVYDIVTSKKDKKKEITAVSLGGLLDQMCDYSTYPDAISASTIRVEAVKADRLIGNALNNLVTKDDLESIAMKDDLDSSWDASEEYKKHIKLWSYDSINEEEWAPGIVYFIGDEHEESVRQIYEKTVKSNPGLVKDDEFKALLKTDVYETYSSIKKDTDLPIPYSEITCGEIDFCDFVQDKYSLYVVAELGASYFVYIFDCDKPSYETAGVSVQLSFDRQRICGIKYNKANIRFITFGPKKE